MRIGWAGRFGKPRFKWHDELTLDASETKTVAEMTDSFGHCEDEVLWSDNVLVVCCRPGETLLHEMPIQD